MTEAAVKTKRSNIPFYVSVTIAIAILLGLGSWQVYRLGWKLDLIQKRELSLQGNPITISDVESGMENGYDVDFYKVKLNGWYRHDATRYVYRPRGKWPGYQVITPFIEKSGFVVMVDRGFIDQRMLKDPIVDDTRKPEGEITITGITRNRVHDKNLFSPDADTKNNIWYWYDLVGIAQSMPENLLDGYTGLPPITSAMFVQLIANGEEGTGKWPDPEDLKVQLPNNHLQYAITWYSLALILAVMSWVFIRRRKADNSTKSD